MRNYVSAPVPAGEALAHIERLRQFFASQHEVTFSSEITAAGKPLGAFPGRDAWDEVRLRAFVLGGRFARPDWGLLKDWDQWLSRCPVWQRMPVRGGIDVGFRDTRFIKDHKGALWDIGWESSYCQSDYITIASPLFFGGDKDPGLAAAAWQAGVEVLGLPIRATPARRGFLLEATGDGFVPQWPEAFPVVFKGVLHIKPWVTKEEFYRRVRTLCEIGGGQDFEMSTQLEVVSQSQADAEEALDFWREPKEEDLVAAWDSFQHWNSLQEKYYRLQAQPLSMAGFEQLFRLNENEPTVGDILLAYSPGGDLGLGVAYEDEIFSFYVGIRGDFPFDPVLVESALHLTFTEGESFEEG